MEENNQNPTSDAAKTDNAEVIPAVENSNSLSAPSASSVANDQNFGDWLKGKRLERKISLEEIAAVTKVHIQQLKSLEQNKVDKLPAPAFVRGFLVSYARHLSIDEDEVLERYKSAFGGSLTPLADLLMPQTSKSARSASAPKVTLVSSPHLKQAPSSKEVEKTGESSMSFKNIATGFGVASVFVLIAILIAVGKKEKNKKNTPPPQAPSAEVSTNSPTRATDSASPINLLATPNSNSIVEASNPSATKQTTDNAALAAANTNSTPAPINVDPVTETKKDAKTDTKSANTSSTPNTSVKKEPAEHVAAANKNATVDTTSAATPLNQATGDKKYLLEIKAIEGNFVHLRVDDGTPKGITLKAGQSSTSDVSKKAVLTISDAGNVEIKWNGTWYAAPGYRGDLKVITLPDQLSLLTPKVAAKLAPKTAAKPKVKKEATGTGDAPAPDVPQAEKAAPSDSLE